MKKFNMFGPVYDYDDYVRAKDVSAFLDTLESNEEFEIYINSPGGSVFEGIAIYNILAPHSKRFAVKIIGEASSIATVISCASDNVMIAESAVMLIHKPWQKAWALDEDYIQKLQKNLSTVKNSILTIYKKKTGKTEDELNDLMTAGDYHSAEECVTLGLADVIYSPSDEETTLITVSNNLKNVLQKSIIFNYGIRNKQEDKDSMTDTEINSQVKAFENIIEDKKRELSQINDLVKQKDEIILNLQSNFKDLQTKYETTEKSLNEATEKLWLNEERLFCQRLMNEGKLTKAEYEGDSDLAKGEPEAKVVKLVALRRMSDELYRMEKKELEARATLNTLKEDITITSEESNGFVNFISNTFNSGRK